MVGRSAGVPAARHPFSLGRAAVDVDQAIQHGVIHAAAGGQGELSRAARWLSHSAGQQP
jgi:hypothetical protein